MAIADRSTATTFRELHGAGRLLLLPNAWDAASARLIEDCGAAAIATTSAGLAWACGFADGDALPPRRLTDAVAAITRVVRIPVSADVEGGYSNDPAAVGDVVAAVLDAGAVGINLEDGAEPPDLLCAKIEAAKRAAARAGVELFVNARTDVYLRSLVPAEQAVEATIERMRRYRAAGCDGIFVPRLTAAAEVRTIVGAAEPLPVNVLAVPGLAPAAELQAWGVRRLSAGSAIAAAALGVARDLTKGFLRDGRSDALFAAPVEYGRMNALLAGRA
jgi:2-methylisocitrate lyase-like PEP mutase family enzyme